MFQLLQPLWPFASAAIIIPVIIHLWNIREGKTLYIGSISLLQESARQQARSLRLKDILVLILRCTLIITLAFLLAKPMWQKEKVTNDKKGWVLIEKQSLQEGYNQNRVVIDSLLNAGYEFHYFNKGFQKAILLEALKQPTDTLKEVQFTYWSLLKHLNEEVPQKLPVYLFTDNKLRKFAGARPEVSMNLQWRTFASTDTVAKQAVKAYKRVDGNNRLVSVNSTSTATYYTSETTNKATNILPDTSSLRITIYTEQFTTDANYLKAAIDAIQQYTGLEIKTSIVNNVDNTANKSDWLFWLSEKPLPKQDVATNVFMYERGKEQQVNSFLSDTKNTSVNQETVPIARIVSSNSNAEIVWKDGFGHAILSVDKALNSTYHFYSRFNPNWNDLPWNSQFVEMIFNLLIKDDISIKDFDKRIIDAAQIQPVLSKTNKGFDKQKFVETTDLTKLFWLLAFVLFSIERYISLTRNKNEAYA